MYLNILRTLAFFVIKHICESYGMMECCGIELNFCKNSPPEQLCKVDENYDKNKIPGILPLALIPLFDILEVAEVNIIDGSISTFIDLNVEWEDQSLAYIPGKTHQNNPWISFDKATSELIWHPRLSFLNLKSVDKMSGFGYKELSSYYINDINSGNNMEMGEVIKVTVYCNFDFQTFPFDEQECDLSLYDEINDMQFTILEEKYLLHYRGNSLTHYDGKEWTTLPYQHGIPYMIRMKSMGTANLTFDGVYEPQSILTIRFSLKRNSFGLLIGSFYLPTGLFAFLSIGSYIIDPEIVPGRMGLLITLFLITFNVYGDTSSDLAPPSRKFSYIEVWMVGVVITISTAILEYFFILTFKRKYKYENLDDTIGRMTLDGTIGRIDFISLIISITFFGCFINLYWLSALEIL